METRVLGRTGPEVTRLGLGGVFVSRLGGGYEQSRSAVEAALELGINYFDTAPKYADSEEVYGRIFRELGVGDEVKMSTKLGGRPQPFDPQDRRCLMASVEESLKVLGREVIDVLYVHEPDRPGEFNWWSDPAEVYGPVVEVLEELVADGVVRHTGLGGTLAAELGHVMGCGRFDVVLTAFNYSVLFREAVAEVFPVAQRQNMGVVLGSVFHQGCLAKRYDEVVRSKPAWLSRARQRQFMALYDYLDELNMELVELSLRFAISNDVADVILIGASSGEQVRESVAAVEKGPLSAAVLGQLDQIAAMVPFRPFEEPMVLPFGNPYYFGPGPANLGM